MSSSLYRAIYAIVAQIPYGRVTSYGQIARLLGNPRLSRIVGCALHAAPPELPCHRVVKKDGSLSDAFLPFGRESHRLLLEAEGVPFLADGRVDMEKALWP